MGVSFINAISFGHAFDKLNPPPLSWLAVKNGRPVKLGRVSN